jgi:hypothetical protein
MSEFINFMRRPNPLSAVIAETVSAITESPVRLQKHYII